MASMTPEAMAQMNTGFEAWKTKQLEGGHNGDPAAGAEITAATYTVAKNQQDIRAGEKVDAAKQQETFKESKKSAEKEIKRQAEEAAKNKSKKTEPAAVDVPYVISNNDNKSYEKFGNNFFILSDGKGNACKGVLLELPAFSMSTKWGESPMSALSEELLKYVNKPEFEFLATKNAGNDAKFKYQVIRRTGDLTAKVYETTDPVSFELTFRCYSGQQFGDDTNLSLASDWKSFLQNSVIGQLKGDLIDTIINNAMATVENAGKQSLDIVSDIKDALKSSIGKDEDETRLESVNDFELENKGNGKFQATLKNDKPNSKLRKKGVAGAGDKNLLATTITLIANTEAEAIQKLNNIVARRNNIINYHINEKNKEDKKATQAELENIEKTIMTNNARVANSVSSYGAQLYKLTIYPFIFKEPLIVYISSWTAKPSKEMNGDSYYYYDFTLSCTMDQVPCAGTWRQNILQI